MLFAGGEMLVRGGVGLSRLFGFSPMLIGLVVISAGTSAPELVIALQGVLTDRPDIAVGTLVGSNISNILLILALGAMIRPIVTPPKIVFRDGGIMVAVSIAFVCMAWNGSIGSMEAFGLLIGFVVFVLGSFALDLRRSNPHSIFETRTAARIGLTPYPGLSFLLLILGMLFLYFGSRLLVNGAMAMALNFGVSQSAVGLTMMAVGSSLPELATTVVASLRRQTGIAIGNIIGSNIFNLLGVVGITAAVHPIAVSAMVAHADALIMLAAAVLLLPLLKSGWRLNRAEGLLLLLLYGAYIAFVASREGLVQIPGL